MNVNLQRVALQNAELQLRELRRVMVERTRRIEELEGEVARLTPAFKCEWCDREAEISLEWECGHASAICETCFGPNDEWDERRGWGMDILDWSTPAICPNCAG